MKSFPVLFISYWGMLLLLVGTLAFFVPHTFMVVARELSDMRPFRASANTAMRLLEPIKSGVFSLFHRSKKGLQKVFQMKKTPKPEVKDVR